MRGLVVMGVMLLGSVVASAQPPDQPSPPIVGPGDAPKPITPPAVPPGAPHQPGDVEHPPVGSTQPGDPPEPPAPAPVPVPPPAPPPVAQPPPAPVPPMPAPWTPPPRPWQRAVPAAPPAEAEEPLGVSADGLPLDWRGLIGLSAAGFSDTAGYSALALSVVADVPLAGKVFFTARLPFGMAIAQQLTGPVMGNPMLGVRGVLRPARTFWVGLRGAAGLPLVSDEAYPEATYQAPPVPHALWNLHEYYPNAFPLSVAADLEGQIDAGLVFRLTIEPVVLFPYVGGEGVELILQHAGEIQLGRDVGGGLRLQGVALPTFPEAAATFDYIQVLDGDVYQFAVEPFFRLERESFMLRTGLMLPMDSQLGPPLIKSWGFRLETGVRL